MNGEGHGLELHVMTTYTLHCVECDALLTEALDCPRGCKSQDNAPAPAGAGQ